MPEPVAALCLVSIRCIIVGAVATTGLVEQPAEKTAQRSAPAVLAVLLVGVVDALHLVFYHVVAFHELYGEIAWREMAVQVGHGLDIVDQLTDCFFEVVAQVDVDVAHNVVARLIDGYYGVEEGSDAFAGTCYNRHHRHAYHGAELLMVEFGAGGPQFVVHVESYYHAAVHVDELGSEEKVALEVGGVHNVDNHIGRGFGKIFAHI